MTEGFHPVHEGALWLEVTVEGKAIHSSVEFKGINAFAKASKVTLALENELRPPFKKKDPVGIL